MKNCFSLLCIVLLFFNLHSCNKSQDEEEKIVDKQELTNELAEFYYTLQLKNNYEKFLDNMHSCDSTNSEYRSRMHDLLIHHKKYISSIKKGVDSITVSHVQYNESLNAAHVFINVNYKDKSSEEIIFPLILKDNEWRIR